ncbi:MAG: hypothetical protein FJ149_09590 [Euryarchaeota archaeon]|nr:hypothetical protein [Euryarchaeota archaeon]
MLLLGSVVILTPPAAAAGWTKTDMGMPYSPLGSYGMMGIAVGNGDGVNGTDIFTICGDNARIYMYRYEAGKWVTTDVVQLIRGSSVYANAILIGDGDDDGNDEVYATATNYSSFPYQGRLFQVQNGTNGWKRTDCGATGYWCYDLASGDGNRDSSKEVYSADYDGHIYEYSKGQTWNSQDIGSSPGFVYGGYTYSTRMNGVAVGDGDNDGKLEVYGASSDNHIYMFTYSGSAWSRTDMGTGETPQYWYYGMQKLVVGDGDNDGKNEVYGASYFNGTIWRYKWDTSTSKWGITKLASLGTGITANDICIGDGNSDGKNEIYVGTSNRQVYEVRLNSGNWEYSAVGSGNGAITGVGTGTVTEDTSVLEVFASSGDGHAYEFYNDAVPPANPYVWSDTHPDQGTWYAKSKVHVMWKDVGYDRSGIDGYSVDWDKSSETVPDEAKDFEQSVHEDTRNLEDGLWYFHIRARDNSLNWNKTATHFGPIRIDTRPPDGLQITVNGGAEYTNDKLVTLSLTASDAGSGVASISFSNDGSTWSEWESFSATRGGWDLTDPRFGANGSDGPKTVHARIRDLVGNEIPADRRASDGIFLDRVAPQGLAIVVNGDATYTASAQVSLSLKGYDPDPASGLSQMSFSNDAATWGDWTPWSESASWSLVAGAGGTDSDGTKIVYFQLRDRAGNVGGPAKDSIFLDRREPGSLSILINDGEDYTNNALVTLRMDAVDPDPGSQLGDMTLANAESSLGDWEPFSKSKGGWSLVSGMGGTDTDGDKLVYLKVRDNAGNIGGPVRDSIFLDRVKPSALGIMINGGAKYATSRDVMLSLRAVDADPSSGISRMQFSNDGIVWTDWEPYTPDRTYTLPAPDGEKTVHFRVRDRAGNIADAVSASIILDTAGPVIANVRVSALTDTTALITWTTDEDSDSLVEFGLSANYGSSVPVNDFVTSHSVWLKGLAPTTTYHFRVQSRDLAGNPPTVTGDYIFITTATPDTTPPSISNLAVSGIADTLAVVTWTTNEPADSVVQYGTDSSYGLKVSDLKNFVLKHSLTLTNLQQSTTYRLRAYSIDPSGNGPAQSEEISFTTLATPDTRAPVISNVRVFGITDRVAVVTWETDEPADGAVEFGTDASYGSKAAHVGMGALHEVTLLNLVPRTTYHFRVLSGDASGNGPGASEDFSFTTLAEPDTTAPRISNPRVVAVTRTGATVLWETDEIADGFVEYGTTTAYGLSSSASEYSLSHSLPLNGLSPDTLYHLRVRSADPSGNLGIGPDVTFRTLKTPAGQDLVPPVISALQVTGVTNRLAIVIWTTDEPANAEVEYGTTTAFGLRASDPAYTYYHSITIDNLQPSTDYVLRVRSFDIPGNGPTVSAEVRFTTKATPDTTAPRITAVTFSNLTNTSVLVTWTTDEPSDSLVEYGTSVFYDRNQTSRLFVLEHAILVTGLEPGTTYHFRVRSTDPSGNTADPSADQSFTTLRKYTPPGGAKPAPTGGEFPWLWAAIAVIIVALAVGLYAASRSGPRKLPPKALDEPRPEPRPEAPPVEARSAALESISEIPVAEAEVVETLDMDEGPEPAGVRPAAFAPAPRPAPEPLRHIRCPSCKTRIPIYKEGAQQITCPGCGRTGPYRPKAVGTLYATEAAAPEPPAPPAPAASPVHAGAPSPIGEAAPQGGAQTPVRMTRCSGCGSQVPIYSDNYPVRITCPGCGRSGMYKGPRRY